MSADELLDIVDEQNRIIGQATRSEIHRQGHRHRAAHMLVFNTRGEVLVQLRSMSKDNNPGLWDTSAAGHVDAGEEYLACAVREIGEELGLVVDTSDLRLLCRFDATASTGQEFQHVYVCTLRDEQPVCAQAEEVDDVRWLERQALDAWLAERPGDFTNDFHRIWQNVLDEAAER